MSDETQVKLEERKVALIKEFNSLKDQVEGMITQGSEINRAVSQIQARQVEIRGALHEVRSLLGEDTTKEPEEVSSGKPQETSKKEPTKKEDK